MEKKLVKVGVIAAHSEMICEAIRDKQAHCSCQIHPKWCKNTKTWCILINVWVLHTDSVKQSVINTFSFLLMYQIFLTQLLMFFCTFLNETFVNWFNCQSRNIVFAENKQDSDIWD